MCVCVRVYVLEYRCPRMSEEGTASPGAGVTECGCLGEGCGPLERTEDPLNQQATSPALVLLLKASTTGFCQEGIII